MGRVDVYPESYCPLLTTSGQELLEAEGGAACRDGTVSSNSHPEAGRRWSDQHHLGCFTYSWASVPWLVCSHFLEACPQNCSSICLGYSLLILWLTSPPAVDFQIYKTAHRVWPRVSAPAPEEEPTGTKSPQPRLMLNCCSSVSSDRFFWFSCFLTSPI